ncbi:MFS transporter [Candidatus Woesebacteria bacterium]|nr:MFS transporter [Candidatus Woesebacteria bacterium]
MKEVRKYYLLEFFSTLHLFGAVMIPMFLMWGKISQAQILFLQSWFMAWIFLLEVPTGVVADFFGRKYSLALGSFIIGIAALLYGSAPHMSVFLVGEFLFALGVSLWSGADKALLYDLIVELNLKDKKEEIFGRSKAFSFLGLLVAAPIGAYIAQHVSLNAPLLFTSIPLFVAAIVALIIKEPKRHSQEQEKTRYVEIMKKGWRYFRTHQDIPRITINAVIVAAAAYFVVWLYQNILTDLRISLVFFGWVNALLVGLELIVSSVYLQLVTFFGSKKRYLQFTALITTFGFFLVGFFPNKLTVLVFVATSGALGLTRFEFISFYLNDFIPSAQRATMLSFVSMVRRFALIIINPLVGLMIERLLYPTLILIGLLPFLSFFFPLERKKAAKN